MLLQNSDCDSLHDHQGKFHLLLCFRHHLLLMHKILLVIQIQFGISSTAQICWDISHHHNTVYFLQLNTHKSFHSLPVRTSHGATLVPSKIESFTIFPTVVPYIYGLVQERRNSIANALELRLSCTNPLLWYCVILDWVITRPTCSLVYHSVVDKWYYTYIYSVFHIILSKRTAYVLSTIGFSGTCKYNYKRLIQALNIYPYAMVK